MTKLEEISTVKELNRCFHLCAEDSFYKAAVQRYEDKLLLNNLNLQEDLRNGTYRRGKTLDFILNERGKVRNINAPTVRDRVVGKTLCQNILWPCLTPYLIYDNGASQKGKGTSFARKRHLIHLQEAKEEWGLDFYIAQTDIHSYFASIDHDTLVGMVLPKIPYASCHPLIEYSIRASGAGAGVNLGDEPPQAFAAYYLTPVDNLCKRDIRYYGRYADDIYLIHNDKAVLKDMLAAMIDKMRELKLEPNLSKTCITKATHGYTFMQVQYKVLADRIIRKPTRAKITRERRRLKGYRRLVDAERATANEARDWYKGWRENLRKDCPQSIRSVARLDSLTDNLFLKGENHGRKTNENPRAGIPDSLLTGRPLSQYLGDWGLEGY